MIILAAVLNLTTVNFGMATLDLSTRPAERHELNPIMKSMFDKPLVLASYKYGVGVVLPELVARKFESKGKKKEAKILRIAAIAVHTIGAASNIRNRIQAKERLFR